MARGPSGSVNGDAGRYRGGFRVARPRANETPVVVEVPHAGLGLDAPSLATIHAPARALAHDADLFVDELFADAPDAGASLIVAEMSRYFVDLNRGHDDFDVFSVEGGRGREAPHGVVWHHTTAGTPILLAPLSRSEFERRLETVYRPYHQALRDLLDEKRDRFGFAVLLCAHSMPSFGRDANGARGQRADVVPGTRGRTSAAASVIDLVEQEAVASGYRVKHDDPYRGGFSTAHYGDPRRHVHAVQVELSRGLYMDESTLRREPNGFARTAAFGRQLVARLGAVTTAFFRLTKGHCCAGLTPLRFLTESRRTATRRRATR